MRETTVLFGNNYPMTEARRLWQAGVYARQHLWAALDLEQAGHPRRVHPVRLVAVPQAIDGAVAMASWRPVPAVERHPEGRAGTSITNRADAGNLCCPAPWIWSSASAPASHEPSPNGGDGAR